MVSNFIFTFGSGVVIGVFVGQNYNLPNIKRWCEQSYKILRGLEETYRK
jgi:hypothetical protein